MQQTSKAGLIKSGAIFVVTFLIAFFATKMFFSSGKKADPKILKEVEMVNAQCPFMVDDLTRYDKVSFENNTVRYDATLVEVEVQSAGAVYIAALKNDFTAKAQANLDTNPETKDFREKGIALQYYYKDKNGKSLFDFSVKPTHK